MNYFTKEKHYNTLDNYYKTVYNRKVFKIPLNGGFTCPNVDGTVGVGGCTFCHCGSGDFAGNKSDPLKIQFNKGLKMMKKKWPDGLLIPYFQANTNTYGPLEKIKALFEEALTLDENIIGLSVGTRPDALGEDVLDYLEDLNKRTKLTIELGLQTINEETSKLINRGHNVKTFDNAVKELRKRKIEVVVHIINGLPNETKNDMINTVRHLNTLDIQGIKIHMLHIMKHTNMGKDYLIKPWPLLTLEEYIDITVTQLRYLKPSVIVHRITGDSKRSLLIEPKWTLKKFVVGNEIDKLMRKNNYFQGDLYEK
ncbi:MAG: TIGR01212 family radical SAM protein [Acholeplasmataceae bacterium]|nr:TIGR01212 family radical SAM protein [Acholeplasmataceae bacterium]